MYVFLEKQNVTIPLVFVYIAMCMQWKYVYVDDPIRSKLDNEIMQTFRLTFQICSYFIMYVCVKL